MFEIVLQVDFPDNSDEDLSEFEKALQRAFDRWNDQRQFEQWNDSWGPCAFYGIEPGTPMMLYCPCPRCSPRCGL